MNTLELSEALGTNLATRKNFKGVFPADCLPKKKLKKPAFVIANTDNRYSPGTHWVAFYFPKGSNKGEFFNSFSGDAINQHFKKFLRTNCKTYIHNKKRIQGDFSVTCGNYCCLFAYYRCIGKTLNQFLRPFTRDYDFNDKKVIHLYHKIFNAHTRNKIKNQSGGNKKRYKSYFQCCKPRVNKK